MTRLVALVRSVEDVAAAISGGIDGLVLPASCGLSLKAVLDRTAGQRPVSFWYDQGGQDAVPDGAPVEALWNTPDDEALSAAQWAVLSPGDLAGVDAAAKDGREGIIIAATGQGRLLADIPIATLERQRQAIEARGLRFGIAGGMEAPDVPRLIALHPDVLVIDDLLRETSAQGPSTIMAGRVRQVRDLVAAWPSAEAGSLSAIPNGPDHIFVRDWIVPLHLGAYAHEQAPQRVRFNIDAEVIRVADRAADMRDVVTYDLIIDAIARATITHVALVETIAEDVAQLILKHPRVSGVDVTVEKLDLGPGALGCRIRRRRAN